MVFGLQRSDEGNSFLLRQEGGGGKGKRKKKGGDTRQPLTPAQKGRLRVVFEKSKKRESSSFGGPKKAEKEKRKGGRGGGGELVTFLPSRGEGAKHASRQGRKKDTGNEVFLVSGEKEKGE